jgi:Cft2 family RNA processing exonuclease
VLEIFYKSGLYLPELDLWLDAQGAKERCIISHAHSDHIAGHRAIIATAETARLFQYRCGEAVIETLKYGERRQYDQYALTLYPAGHCLGAAQVLVETEKERLVYTGDFKLSRNLTAGQAEIIPCDTLVMESTFGDPLYRFPPEAETAERLYNAVDRALTENRIPVVLAYSLGKSQEGLEWLLRRGYRVMLHGAIWHITEIYREMGVTFSGEYEKYDRQRLKGCVLIAPPNCRKQPIITSIARRYTILLTGWAMSPGAPYRYPGIDLFLPLSDHADYEELVKMARETGAQRIFTLYGSAKFAASLRSLGLAARHLISEANSQPFVQPRLF